MNDPIAIVGISCRVPGASGPDEFWSLLRDGTESIGEAPERAPGIGRGGFLDDVEGFDAGFFRISPREAAAMDPQQRLALELGWEGLEDAGLGVVRPGVGVFMGVMGSDYGHVLAESGAVSHHTMPGQGRALIANRVSYALGLDGPSLTVDTGQSSSLVAVHLACQSLRENECSAALAGGVNLILSPLSSRATIEFGALSPDGRCYAWDERANGHVRGEGGGIVVLKRLQDAQAAGDRIYGVIRGSGLSTGSGEGLTVPDAGAQRAAIEAALSRACVMPDQVQYVELHGTGTPVGDPIEARALAEAYGRDRAERLAVGSVKTNLGHLEGAAGITGLIKTTLCVYHAQLVASLNFERPNPEIELDTLRVAQATEAWAGAPRRAGVSSFGMGGANCHVVLEQPPVVEAPERPDGPVPVLLSAHGTAALVDQARRLRAFVAEREPDLADVGFSLARGRARLGERAAVVADDAAGLLKGLDALVADTSDERVLRATACDGRVVFVFPGQGSQWEGMAAELLATSPVFAASIEACEAALAPQVEWSLRDVLSGRGPGLDRVDVVQPALWAVMVSLAALWRAHGVEPGAVIGHSQGEIAAAAVAGALSLEDAARVVALRSLAIAEGLAGQGGMASIALDVETLQARLPEGLSVAAVNGPRSVVVAGEDAALDALLETLAAEGVWVRRVPVDYPSHSPAVERLEQRLLADLAPITPVTSEIAFYSTLEGELIDTATLDASYWYRNLRSPVRFAPTIERLLADGAGLFVEPSPHPVLVTAITDTIEQAGAGAAAIGTLRRDDGCLERFTCALANGDVHGAPVDWGTVFAGARRISAPPYAFQRTRHWLEPASGATGDLRAAGLAPAEHPLLAATVRLAHARQTLFTGRVTEGHEIFGRALVSGAAVAELALHAGAQSGARTLEALTLHAPVGLPADVQVAVGDRDEEGRHVVAVHAREDDGPWRSLAEGVLSDAPTPDAAVALWPPPAATAIDAEALAERLAERGHTCGTTLRAAWQRGDALFAELAVDEHAYGLHPALLDAALALEIDRQEPGAWVMAAIEGMTVPRPGATALRVQIDPTGRIDAHDAHGELVFTATVALSEHDPDALLELAWAELDAGDGRPGPLVVLRRAVAVVEHDVPDLAAAAMWGRLRAEQPGDFTLVDTDGPMDRMGPLPGGEPQLALRGGRAYAPRLARAGASDGRSALQGTVLVTGAGEPAGAGVARRLASHAGIERLLLVDAPDALVAELGPRAVAIRARELDTALVHEPELHAVIHTTVDARLAERLDGRTAGRELDAFLCFASATAMLGAGGDPQLAGASAALAALAVRRRERGLPAQVLAWERLPHGGDAWLDLFERALRHPAPYLIVARENLAALPDSSLLADVKPAATRTLARRVAALPEAERPALVLGLVREHTAAVLAHSDPDAIEPDRRFKDLGMDSITAVALRNRLVQATGVALPTTLIFDHPSCAAVTRVLMRTLAPESDPVAAPADDERVNAIDAMDVDDLIRMTYAMES